MKRKSFLLDSVVFLALAIGLVGCAGTGTRNRVSFDNSKYPVSLSPVVPDKNGNNLSMENLERLGTFKARQQGFATIWGFFPIGEIDFSDELNRQVQALDGKAVVDLRIKAIDTHWNWWFGLHWLPFWPGCVNVEVEGVVVRPL